MPANEEVGAVATVIVKSVDVPKVPLAAHVAVPDVNVIEQLAIEKDDMVFAKVAFTKNEPVAAIVKSIPVEGVNVKVTS